MVDCDNCYELNDYLKFQIARGETINCLESAYFCEVKDSNNVDILKVYPSIREEMHK